MYSPWNSLFAPGTKKFDISFQEATITAQRKKTVDFTSSYLNANQGVLLSKTGPGPAQPRRPEEAADLRADEHDRASTGSRRSCIRRRSRSRIPTTTAAYQAVQINRCQAMILDVPLVSLEKKAHPTKFGPSPARSSRTSSTAPCCRRARSCSLHVTRRMKTLTTNGTDRQAAEEVVQPQLRDDPGPEVEASMHALHQVLHAFFNPHSFTLAMPDVWAGFQVNLRMMFIAEALVLVFALIDRSRPRSARARSEAAPRPGDRLHRLLPRHADHHRRVHRRLRVAGPAARLHLEPLVHDVRDHRADARVHGVRDRGLPRRHRVGAPEPARRGAVARPLVRADDALRRHPAGGAPRDPAALERLRRPAEGHGDRRR